MRRLLLFLAFFQRSRSWSRLWHQWKVGASPGNFTLGDCLELFRHRFGPGAYNPLRDHKVRCLKCGRPTYVGYGLAGGGCGIYWTCDHCNLIVQKRQDRDEE